MPGSPWAGRSIPVYAPAGLAERADLDDSPALDWHEVTGR